MENNVLITLSLVASFDGHTNTIFENFLPLLKYIVVKNELYVYNQTQIRDYLKEYFKLDLPSYVIDYISTKFRKNKYMKKENGKYVFTDKAYSDDNIVVDIDERINKFSSNFKELYSEFIQFASTFENYKNNISLDDFDKLIFINIYKVYDSFIKTDFLKNLKIDKNDFSSEDQFIFLKFIGSLKEKKHSLFNNLLDICFGYTISELFFNTQYEKQINLTNLNCYLDTRIVLNLFGAHGEYYEKSAKKLTESLYSSGAKLCIFQHTYEEINDILTLSKSHWNDYDPSIANDVLRHFKRQKDKSLTDLEILINSLDEILEINRIVVTPTPDIEGEKEISDKICTTLLTYRNRNTSLDEKSARRDSTSVASVIKLRKSINPKTLKKVKHLFLTSSVTLINTLSKLKIIKKNQISPCHSDMFIGSLLWLSNKKKFRDINRMQFAAIAQSMQKVDKAVFKKFIKKFSDLCKKDEIPESLVSNFLQDRMLEDILVNHTLNDPERLTDENIEIIKKQYIDSLKKNEILQKESAEKERDILKKEDEQKAKRLKEQKTKRLKIEAKYRKRAITNSKIVQHLSHLFIYLFNISLSYILSLLLSKGFTLLDLIAIGFVLAGSFLIEKINWNSYQRSIERKFWGKYESKINQYSISFDD